MTVKVCYKCGESKPVEQFHKNSHKADGRQTYCKTCMKVRNKAYYVNTPERNAQRQESKQRGRKIAREYVWQYLLDHPCIDCSFKDPRALEFDHVRGIKEFNVSEMVLRGMTLSRIQLEIAKCEVRCANCHHIKTSESFGWYSGPATI